MKKIFFFAVFSIFFLFGYSIYQYISFYDNKLHVIFCDVGQGDAIFVKTPNGTTLLVDGGPDKSVLQCLSGHLPFWTRNISMVILTHPHADHIQGLLYAFDAYHVDSFVTEDLKNTTFGYRELLKKIMEQKISYQLVSAGDRIAVDNVAIEIIGPTLDFLHTTSPNGMIGENKEFASLETLLIYGNFSALFTGDSQETELQDSLATYQFHSTLSILQVPHHGSASGLSREVLALLNPHLAAISVGLHNMYHHPNPFTLALLKESHIPVQRTDKQGDIEIVSDGRN